MQWGEWGSLQGGDPLHLPTVLIWLDIPLQRRSYPSLLKVKIQKKTALQCSVLSPMLFPSLPWPAHWRRIASLEPLFIQKISPRLFKSYACSSVLWQRYRMPKRRWSKNFNICVFRQPGRKCSSFYESRIWEEDECVITLCHNMVWWGFGRQDSV